jgi:hypothetical protein
MRSDGNVKSVKIFFESDDATRTILESILFYLQISKQEILNESYGNLGNPQIISIIDCINVLRAANYIVESDTIPSNTEHCVVEWMELNPEKYNKITE